MNSKVNNDILIPRSILKKNTHPEAKLMKETTEFDFIDELEHIDNANLLYNEAVIGKHIDHNNTILKTKHGGQDNLENQYKILQLQEQA